MDGHSQFLRSESLPKYDNTFVKLSREKKILKERRKEK